MNFRIGGLVAAAAGFFVVTPDGFAGSCATAPAYPQAKANAVKRIVRGVFRLLFSIPQSALSISQYPVFGNHRL